jgi:hypothetical protein
VCPISFVKDVLVGHHCSLFLARSCFLRIGMRGIVRRQSLDVAHNSSVSRTLLERSPAVSFLLPHMAREDSRRLPLACTGSQAANGDVCALSWRLLTLCALA